MDYISLIHTVIDPLLENPDTILVREIPQESEKDKTYLIVSNSEDTAHLIGKKGCVAFAIREILSIAGKLENKRVHVKFESFEQEKE
ncbi:MAG: KH domain-containing protein [Candidatus Onthovivens sp.]|nr:KH domain-containing protein [Candidatus Onthovivens sp.]